MTDVNMGAMVEVYFRGVDLRDRAMILSVMSPDGSVANFFDFRRVT
jgi:hypothetical protein